MKDKKVKTRKEHICGVCEKTIEKGSIATFGSCRMAKYNTEEEQIGIQYVKYHICNNCH